MVAWFSGSAEVAMLVVIMIFLAGGLELYTFFRYEKKYL
jgi:hypothetical protein